MSVKNREAIKPSVVDISLPKLTFVLSSENEIASNKYFSFP